MKEEVVSANTPRSGLTEEQFEITNREGLRIGGRLFVPQGTGPFPAVVVVHGFGGTYREGMYRAILRGLAAAGTLGVGFEFADEIGPASVGDFVGVTFPQRVSDAGTLLDFVLQHPLIDSGRVGLCGHSMGGVVTVAVASRRPEVKALVIISTSWDPQGEITVLWETTPERWRGLGYVDLSTISANWGVGGKKVTYGFYESFDSYDASEIAPKLSQPTLVVYGEADNVVSPERSRQYFASLTSEKRLVTIKNGDHIFSDPVALDQATKVIAGWFSEKLKAPMQPAG